MTVYTLLVGINKYKSARVQDLNGCVADIRQFEEFLRGRVEPEDLAEPLILLDEQATRAAIINGFKQYLSQAQNGDVALFCYSGHGSQEQAPAEFWELEPDRKNETLVCHDSRMDPYTWDLADKELAYLIELISKNKPDLHTLVILDSCHSGSGTRDDEGGVRMNPSDTRTRPLDSYEIDLNAISSTNGENWYKPPAGKHILMAACRPEELARERVLGEDRAMQGVFTHHMLTALQQAGPNFSYRNLAKHVNALVRLTVSHQTPQIEASESLDQPFLGGKVQARPLSYTARYDRDLNSWVMDGGTIHGISSQTTPETTELALFPTLTVEDGIDLKQSIGQVKISQVFPAYSKIESKFRKKIAGETVEDTLDQTQTYQGVVVTSPLSPRLVHLTGDDETALTAIREAVATVNNGMPSLLVKIAENDNEVDQADLQLVALPTEQRYRINRSTDSQALVVDTPYTDPGLAADRLQHIARWLTTYELNNPHTGLAADAIQLEVTAEEGQNSYIAEEAGDLRLSYTQMGETWRAPRLRFRLINPTAQTLFCTLLNITPDFEVWPVSSNTHGMIVEVPAGGEASVVGHGRLKLEIEDPLWQQGMIEKSELFKLIINTNNFDASLLALDPLPVEYVGMRGDRGALNQLMKTLGFRASVDDEDPIFNDWRTVDLTVTTHRSQGAVKLEAGDRGVVLAEGVTLIDQAGLTGLEGQPVTAQLMTNPESSRDLGSLALPGWLLGDGAKTEPLVLTATRSVGQPGLSVLALDNVANAQSVTREKPLNLMIPATLAENERLLTYSFDGEFFLPLGWATRTDSGTEIRIERLPEPGGSRSLTNSIRIYFQKVLTEKLGLAPKYPRLSLVTPGEKAGEVDYNDDPDIIAAKVADANRVLLYIHGIIGESGTMSPSAWVEIEGQRLADQYDLVLAYDYENLATGIGKTALALRDKLATVGLGSNHGKTFHIFAHSMGGLVSRWMIEHLDGGNEMVQHLFLFGTPNGGSPWPKIEDYAITLLTIGLNSLAPITWPVSAVTGLLAFIEKNDKMLDEMAVDSELLEGLAQSPDPGLPYTIFAGNTSIIESARQTEGGRKSTIERLLSRINITTLMHNTTSLAFFNQPNDVAVSVDSVYTITDARTPKPIKHEVACDHMTYFVAEGGLSALIEAVTMMQAET
ncbi:MAG: caspase family protein [Chloroflexota bacterium]